MIRFFLFTVQFCLRPWYTLNQVVTANPTSIVSSVEENPEGTQGTINVFKYSPDHHSSTLPTELANIDHDVFGGTQYEIDKESFVNSLCDARISLLVATVNHVPVGFAFLYRSTRCTEICRFAVHKDYRQMGVGTALIQHAIEAATTMQVCTIETTLMENFVNVEPFLEQHGFADVGRYHTSRKMVRTIKTWR